MHSAVSNSLCTAAFLCFMTYLTLYMDTCLMGSTLPSENMCLALFRNTPFPQIVVAVVSVYIMMLFFVSLALAFVSCPQASSAWLRMYQLGYSEKKKEFQSTRCPPAWISVNPARNRPRAEICEISMLGSPKPPFQTGRFHDIRASPQDVPSFTFVSKGSLLMTAVTVGYAYDMAAWYGTVGCPRNPSTVKDPTLMFVGFMSSSLCVGIIAAAGELLGDIWGLRPSTIGFWIHMISDVATISVGGVCSLFITKLDGGGVGGMPSMHIGKWAAMGMFGIVGLWSFVDLLVCIIQRGRGFGAMTGSAPVIESAKIQQQEGVPVPVIPQEIKGEGGGEPFKSQFVETSVSISPPFHVTHMVDDDMGNYSLMKKRDAMPATNASPALTTASHQQHPVTNMFSSDEVRRSLRQRGAGVLHTGL